MAILLSIIGVEKAGTTSLQAATTQEFGIRFFPGEFSGLESPDFETLHGSDPKNLLAGVTGLKRPSLLHNPLALQRLKNLAPQATVVCVLRDPISRFVSASIHMMRMGIIRVATMDHMVNNVFDVSYLRRNPRATNLLNFGLYSDALELAEMIFGPKLLIFGFPELHEATESVLRKLQDRLGSRARGLGAVTLPLENVGVHSPLELHSHHYSNRLRFSYSFGNLRLHDDKGRNAKFAAQFVKKSGRKLSRYFPGDSRKMSLQSRAVLNSFYELDRLRLLNRYPENSVYWGDGVDGTSGDEYS